MNVQTQLFAFSGVIQIIGSATRVDVYHDQHNGYDDLPVGEQNQTP